MGTPVTVSGTTVTFPSDLAEAGRRFLETLPYEPRVFLLDELVEVDREQRSVLARLDTTKALPLTDAQRGDPAQHPRHVNGGIMVHLTGVLGLVHAFFIDGCRFDEGWIGFGSRIHEAEFKRLARTGPPLELRSREVRRREGRDRRFVRYEFRFTQEGAPCYLSEQTATWLRGRALGSDSEA